MDMLNAVKSVLADVSNVSPSSEQRQFGSSFSSSSSWLVGYSCLVIGDWFVSVIDFSFYNCSRPFFVDSVFQQLGHAIS